MHLAKEAFAESGVLMGLLVLAIFPGVRGGNQRKSQPLCRTAHFFLMASKDDLLPNGPEHFDAESFIAGHQINAALVGQAGRDHGLLIKRRDDLAIYSF